MFNSYSDAYNSERKNASDKWEHYFEIYDHVFQHLYNQPINYLEIGVQNGGSLETARKLFGQGAKIVGLDIDPSCARIKREGIADDIFIGHQADPKLLSTLTAAYPKFDLVIDDGSHVQYDMIVTFINLFPFISENGIYLIEDTHTNHYAGNYQQSFFGIGLYDYFKGLSERLNIDWINTSFSETRYKRPRETRSPKMPNKFVDQIFSIEFFDSIIAVRKKTKLEPLRRIK